MRHDLTLTVATRRYLAECSCGWRSAYTYRSTTGAHLEYGQHLVEQARLRPDCGHIQLPVSADPDPSRPAEEPFNHRAAPVAVASVVDGLVDRGGADRAAQADGSSTATGGAAA